MTADEMKKEGHKNGWLDLGVGLFVGVVVKGEGVTPVNKKSVKKEITVVNVGLFVITFYIDSWNNISYQLVAFWLKKEKKSYILTGFGYKCFT
jgi:hypothetical protein